MTSTQAAEAAATPPLEITTSRQMLAWMAEQKLSIAFTTYQIGKLFFLGLNQGRELSVFERTFNRCMGLHASADAQTIWMASLYQLWRLENYVPRGQQTPDGYDALYVPTVGYTTGELDTHDIAIGPGGRPMFCATRFNCIATISETHSFRPLWKPPFIELGLNALVPEDRCHLNGIAAHPDGELAYATVVGRSNVPDGWRAGRVGGGELLETGFVWRFSSHRLTGWAIASTLLNWIAVQAASRIENRRVRQHRGRTPTSRPAPPSTAMTFRPRIARIACRLAGLHGIATCNSAPARFQSPIAKDAANTEGFNHDV